MILDEFDWLIMIRRRFLQGIEEFWRAPAIRNPTKVGRSWSKEELSIKSFDDLHRLWYVCLKEKNLLYTEKQHCRSNRQEFLSDKALKEVQNTMKNIKLVSSIRKKEGQLLPCLKSPLN